MQCNANGLGNLMAQAVEFAQTRCVRADNRKCRLTYWLNRRLYSASAGIVSLLGRKTPPRQASLATPPQEGNYLSPQERDTTPPSFACHPSAGGELFVSAGEGYHPAKLRLPPLRRRGIICLHRRGIPPRQASLATPPQEGNYLSPQEGNTTPSSFACHPSTGGELFASTGGEYHPVKLRLPPLHRRGIVCLRRRGTPPRQAELDTPPKEGNCRLHRRGIPPRQASPPSADAMQLPQCICARHLPSTGGEWSAPTVFVNLLARGG